MAPSCAKPLVTAGLSTGKLAAVLEIDRGASPAGRIDWGQVDRISTQIAVSSIEFRRATWSDDRFWNVYDEPADRSQFFAIGNSINFRFWELRGRRVHPATGELDGEVFSGAMYMWRALRRELDRTRGELLDADFLANLSEAGFDRIFTDDRGANPLTVARADRVENLRDLGEHLRDSWGGAFFNLVEASDRSLATFARLARDLRAFDDPLLKLTMLTAILHSGSGVHEFADDPLPAVDYHLLKQVLRQGMVKPERSLGGQLAASRLLDPTDAAELRRLALLALIGVSERTGLSGEVLDNRFWLNRLNCVDPDPVCLDPASADRCPFYGACKQLTRFERPLELTRYY